MPAMAGPGTPYITPAVLRRAPTGIDWSSIPNSRSGVPEQVAEQMNICLRSTGMVDITANQVLRATLDTEYFTGPDWRFTVRQQTGEARLLCARSPILQVVQASYSFAGAYPRSWQPIAQNFIDIETPPLAIYGTSAPTDAADGGQVVLLAPGTTGGWFNGRNTCRIALQYISGWPHTSLTGAVAAGVSTVPVDDITGWAPPVNPQQPAGFGVFGAMGIVYDGLQQEVVTCTSVTPNTAGAISGPGTLTFSAPLSFGHGQQTLVTTLPQTIINAAIDYSAAQALERGATATVIQSVSGGGGDQGGPITAERLREWADLACKKFGRVI